MNPKLKADYVLTDVNLATMDPVYGAYGILKNAAIAINEGHICWIGDSHNMPEFEGEPSLEACGGQWLTPGLIDSHTHLVFAGSRADEFEQRLEGVSYEEIARRGGGIKSTVASTRACCEATLLKLALRRAKAMLDQGVTSMEIKSGYGLDLETEIKMLRVARQVGEQLPVTVKTTFLGAHALPLEYADRADAYIDLVCDTMLPEIARQGLADGVDVFCESIGFNLEQTNRVFARAQSLGLPVKLHAEQLSNLGGSELAASYQALSVDHIEFLDQKGVEAIAKSGTVATLLPGAFYFLRETRKPPVELLRQFKVPMAIATDFNPGSSPLCSLPLMLNMACTFFALTPEEALAGVTRHSARALGMEQSRGSLEVGKVADMVLWDIDHPNELAYQFGVNPVSQVWCKGNRVQR